MAVWNKWCRDLQEETEGRHTLIAFQVRRGPRSSWDAARGWAQYTTWRSATWTPCPPRCFGTAGALCRTPRPSTPLAPQSAPTAAGRCRRPTGAGALALSPSKSQVASAQDGDITMCI